MGSLGPSTPLRIAVLECDTPLPETGARYKGYGGVFESLLRAGAKSLGRPEQDDISFSMHQIQIDPENYPRLEDVDGILITGSRYDSFDNSEWILKLVEFTKVILAQDRIRLIGVCFGHQIIARALGVEVGRNADGWEAGVNEVDLTEKGKEIFGVQKLALHQMHRDVVYALPDGVEQLGFSPVCKIQGMYVVNRLISVQGHPEFNKEIMTEIVNTRHELGVFDDDAYKEHIGKVGKDHDGLVVSRAFIAFLLDG